MIPKDKRNYVDCWDENKIKQVLEERLKELRSKSGKSKSRVKLLRAKISKLRKALEGKAIAGGQVAPSSGGGVKSGKRSKKLANKAISVSNDEDTQDNLNTDVNVDDSNSDTTNIRGSKLRTSNDSATSKSINKTKKKSKKICFGCRKRGHLLKDCRENRTETVCFRCGSKEHTLKNCPLPPSSSVVSSQECTLGEEGVNVEKEEKLELPFASCFVCGQLGHLSSQCLKNPKGMFPKGSGCYFCGSVRHKRIHCPVAKGGGSGSNNIPIRNNRNISVNSHKGEK